VEVDNQISSDNPFKAYQRNNLYCPRVEVAGPKSPLEYPPAESSLLDEKLNEKSPGPGC